MTDTKEKILTAALHLFARDGFEAVSVSSIAGELGITKGALYRHYADKRDIFDSIVRRMEQRDAEQAHDFALPETAPELDPEAYRRATIDSIFAFSRAQFRYWTEDSFAADFRKMLTLEQFRDADMMALYQQYLAAGPLRYVTDLLAALGLPDPEVSAAGIYAPMFLLYTVYDGAADKAAVTCSLDALLDSVLAELERKISTIRR